MGGVGSVGACFEVPPHFHRLRIPPKGGHWWVLGVALVLGQAAPAVAGGWRGHSPTIPGTHKAVFQEMTETKSECGGLLRTRDLWLNS